MWQHISQRIYDKDSDNIFNRYSLDHIQISRSCTYSGLITEQLQKLHMLMLYYGRQMIKISNTYRINTKFRMINVLGKLIIGITRTNSKCSHDVESLRHKMPMRIWKECEPCSNKWKIKYAKGQNGHKNHSAIL